MVISTLLARHDTPTRRGRHALGRTRRRDQPGRPFHEDEPSAIWPVHHDLGGRSGYVATWQATVNRALLAAASVEKKPFTPIVVDGVFGPLTQHATRRFQRVFKVPVTGTVGVSSWKAWYESSLTAACAFGTPPTVEGEVGPCIGWWQLTVNKWLAKHRPSAARLVPDGVFGPLTLAATVSFQAASGLVADGVVGRHTWNSAADQKLT